MQRMTEEVIFESENFKFVHEVYDDCGDIYYAASSKYAQEFGVHIDVNATGVEDYSEWIVEVMLDDIYIEVYDIEATVDLLTEAEGMIRKIINYFDENDIMPDD